MNKFASLYVFMDEYSRPYFCFLSGFIRCIQPHERIRVSSFGEQEKKWCLSLVLLVRVLMLLSQAGSPNAARCGHAVAVTFQRSARYCVPFCNAMVVAAKARISDDPPVECNTSCLDSGRPTS
jgi:hypothetical protein